MLIVLLVTTACQRGDATSEKVSTDVVKAESTAQQKVSGPLRFEDSRSYDLDGNGAPESLRLEAAGPAWDSMNVALFIKSPAGATIYTDSFTTLHYTGLDPDPAMSRASIDSVVRSELAMILSEESIVPTSTNYHSDLIDLRSTFGYDRPEPEFVRFRDDLMKRPMFKYYLGGETSTGITWSSVLGKFVETASCC